MGRMSEADMDKFCKQVPGEFKKYCEIHDVKVKDAPKKFKMSYETLNKRNKSPGDYTLKELLRMASWMNVSLFTLLGKDVSP